MKIPSVKNTIVVSPLHFKKKSKVKELSTICQEGTNSPAARPEIVDLELDSAQFLKVGEPEVNRIRYDIGYVNIVIRGVKC